MRLFVCYTKRELHLPGRKHACAIAYDALKAAGHDPEVVRSYSFGGIPDTLQTPARKKVKEKTGSNWVPALQTDDGEWIGGSKGIVAWAEQHPAAQAA